MKAFIGLLYLVFAVFILSMTVYGLYLSFAASVILGLIVLIAEPSPAIIGIVMFFFDKNIPELVLQWLNN